LPGSYYYTAGILGKRIHMKRIVFTGGGTAGHVTPNLAILEQLDREKWEVHYVGTADGMERGLIKDMPGITYHAVSSGKLRRYFDWRNFTDPFRVLAGAGQAHALMRKIRPAVVFSKGGFVTVPVVAGAWLAHVPVILHESDITPGLANKLAMPFASMVCTSFPETADHIHNKKVLHTGSPIRRSLLTGDRKRGHKLSGLTGKKPVLLIMGGSTGAQAINNEVDAALDEILAHFDIIHIRGRENVKPGLNRKGYMQFDYVTDDLKHLMAVADIVLSRAGANAIFEFLALDKPMLLIPYPLGASRGDQILNARSFQKQGYAETLMQEDVNTERLVTALRQLYRNRHGYIANMRKAGDRDTVGMIMEVIEEAAARD
jgi:UDP-N-acetylglucosamine--N-acetylmuramyl-(pentapeptide) pyrophosphoryl-undecaprenol N-acetylglucosamine transferase